MYAAKHGGGDRISLSVSDTQRAESTVPNRGVTADGIKLVIDVTVLAVDRLLNDPQGDSAPNLLIRVDAWEAQVFSALTESDATEVDKSWFRVLSTYQPAGLPGATPEHAKIRNELAEKVERLREITRRLEERLRSRRR